MEPLTTGKQRLIVVTSLFPPAVGGAAEDFRLLTEEWRRAEAVERIVILTERYPGSPAREQRDNIVVRRVLPPRDTRPALKTPNRLIRSVLTYSYLVMAIAWELHRSPSQVVLVHGRYGRKSFLRILRLMGAKTVVFLSDRFTPPERLADCHAVICNANNVYQEALRQLGSGGGVFYVPLPFVPPLAGERQSSGVRAAEPFFLFAGNVSLQKGVDVLLKAFASFHKEHPQYHLLLAGPVCDPSVLNHAGPGVTVLGAVDRKTTTELMMRAEAVVLPSRSEALPRVCLEAIALGRKVICPPGVSELRQWCPEWTLPAVSPKEVYQKLTQTLSPCFIPSFDFRKHDPKLAGEQILRICAAVGACRSKG